MRETLVSDPIGGGFLSRGPAANDKVMINRDRVAAWWLPLEHIGEAHWPRLESLLIPEERARARKFHFERDRLVYIAAHAMGRGLLSYCMGHSALSWRFTVEAHGKPEVICPPGAPRLRINLSHTRGFAAAALTVDHDIGVDVEWRQRDVQTEKLAERVFAEEERRILAAAPASSRVDTFLAFWTLKEAYVKAIGKGLAQPLDAFAFDLDSLRIRFNDSAVDDPAHWHFERFRPSPDHLMALAVRHPEPGRLCVDVEPAPLDYLLGLPVS